MPAALADAALIAGPTCAATGDVSTSQWNELVKNQKAPQPVIRQPRFTRWRLADVRDYWIRRAAEGSTPADTARVRAKAQKASDAARAKANAGPHNATGVPQ